MSFIDIFFMAIKAMLKRKLRTFLTILGVVIGTASITVMVSLGVGVNQAFDTIIEEMGPSALTIHVWGNSWDPSPFEPILNDDIVEQINNHYNVVIATPIISSWLTLTQGRYEANVTVVGIKPEAMELLGFNVEQGNNLTNSDDLQIVLGGNAPFQFRNQRNRNQFNWGWQGSGIEATIDLLNGRMQLSIGENSRPLMVQPIGILYGHDFETSDQSFMPLSQLKEIEELRERANRNNQQNQASTFISGSPFTMQSHQQNEGYDQVRVLANNVSNVEEIITYIENMGISNVFSQTQWINAQRESTEMLQGLLSAIGAVSLVVAAISIANTMIMSIYERTREIGVMKVIGASVKDIRRLFLVEASLIGAVGGAFGLVLSFIISYIINSEGLQFLGELTWIDTTGTASSVIPVWLYILAFTFSSFIGLVSGFLPARRATKISALAAIKTD